MKAKICIFKGKATKDEIMTTNGEYILDNICINSEISEKTNEDYSCKFTFQLNKEYEKEINMLVEDNILRALDEEGEEPFRIVNVIKNTKTIDVFTVHLTIRDTINMWLEDVRPTNQSGQGAISWMFDNAKGGNNFNVTSNISNLNSASYYHMSLYNALYGADNSFINRWGGETRRRGFNITINDKIGTDRGMQIRSKKNLTGFESKTNLDQLCTCLYIKGFDGIKLDSPINSPLINNYSKPYFKDIKFEDIKVKNENNNEGYETLVAAQAEMLRRGKLQFSEKNIDVIKATYTIKFAQLEKTEEYKDYSMIERAFLGDTVEVIEDNYNVNIKVRVIARKFDVLKQERVETTLSNLDIKDKPVKVEDIIKELEKELSGETRPNLGDYINSMMQSGLKDSYVIHKANETLYMNTNDINTATTVLRVNRNGIGASTTGYFGRYEYGMTLDGKINASMISTGVLLADLIKAGMLKSFNGKTWINMDDGTFNFADMLKFNSDDGALWISEKVKIGDNMFFSDGQSSSNGTFNFISTINSDFNMYYSEYGVFYPYKSAKSSLGRNDNYFNNVYASEFGRERNGDTVSTLKAQNVYIRSGYAGDGIRASDDGYLKPVTNNDWSIGGPTQRFATMYYTNLNAASDLKLKKNVRYLNSNTRAITSDHVTTNDHYSFVKEDLKLANFDYVTENKNIFEIETSNNKTGFIAQDIENTKVGKQLVKMQDGLLSYDLTDYVNVLAGALQVAIQKIEWLEKEINLLKKRGNAK